jgi:hypothetical protein
LCSYIEANGKDGKCDFTGDKSKVVDIVDLTDFFESLVDSYVEDIDGIPLYEIIQSDWNVFNDDYGHQILSVFLREIESTFKIDTIVRYSILIDESVKEWDRIKDSLINHYRYLTVKDIRCENYFEESFAVHEAPLKHPMLLYRSRININGDNHPIDKNNMGAPSKPYATAGRANPEGIPFLYLSSDPETTFYETRAIYLDCVSTGSFFSNKELRIVDFTYQGSPFNPIYSNVQSGIISEKLAQKISHDLSNPMRRGDSVVDYVPTQFICEYIKYLAKADGIAFRSSLYDGINYVFFDVTAFECNDVKIHKIGKVTIEEEKAF